MDKQKYQPLKGFRDFLGPDVKKRQWLIGKIRNIFELYGFEPLETPALEYDELLSGKYGDEADKLIYRFEDRGKRKVALRYDQTVPTARVISQYRNILTFPYKRYQIQPVWRADKPQKGRFREFLHCDADIIGSSSVLADAEILAVYWHVYNSIGLDSLIIKMNDREQVFNMMKKSNVDDKQIFLILQSLDKLDKKPRADIIDELEAKGIKKDISESMLLMLSTLEPSQKLNSIIEKAQYLGVPKRAFSFSPTLVRGLDYYTGFVFEGFIPEYENLSVGGGGRYDNLIQNLVGVDYPAVGFGLGFDRTLEALEKSGKLPNITTHTDVLVSVFSEELQSSSLDIAHFLRNAGIATEVILDTSLKIDKQLSYANKKNIPYVIIIGPDEERQNKILLKNMIDGTQALMSKDDIIQKINNK